MCWFFGGGYTSCVLATLFKSNAIVFNPQLICCNWSKPHIDRLKDGVLCEDQQLLEDRLNLNLIIEKFNYLPSLHIFYNVVAKEDIDNQLIPFVSKLSEKYSVMEIKDRIRFDFYTNEKGHNGMIDNDDTIKLIEQDLKISNITHSGKNDDSWLGVLFNKFRRIR